MKGGSSAITAAELVLVEQHQAPVHNRGCLRKSESKAVCCRRCGAPVGRPIAKGLQTTHLQHHDVEDCGWCSGGSEDARFGVPYPTHKPLKGVFRNGVRNNTLY